MLLITPTRGRSVSSVPVSRKLERGLVKPHSCGSCLVHKERWGEDSCLKHFKWDNAHAFTILLLSNSKKKKIYIYIAPYWPEVRFRCSRANIKEACSVFRRMVQQVRPVSC